MSDLNSCHSYKLSLANSQQTKNLGFSLGQSLQANTVILLQGNLGVGKTTLVQGLGLGLGITEAIASPTFTLVNEYTKGRIPLYHLDLYRLTSQQTKSIYPEIYWEGAEVEPGITAIEWSERLSFFPDNYLEINLLFDNSASDYERGRTVIIKMYGEYDLDLSFLDNFAEIDGL